MIGVFLGWNGNYKVGVVTFQVAGLGDFGEGSTPKVFAAIHSLDD